MRTHPKFALLVETRRGPDDNQKAVLEFHNAILKHLTLNKLGLAHVFTAWLL